MSYQNIDASVSAADLQAIKDAFTTIRTKMPFLVNLTAQERKAIFKTGSDSLSFVQNALTGAQGNPLILPGSFDVPGFERDVNLFATLTEVQTIGESLTSQIDDTRLAVGGEAMQSGIQFYNYVKTAAKTTPGLKPLADQLGQRFQRTSNSKPVGTPST